MKGIMSALLELVGAAAITIGAYHLVGVGAAWIVGGLLVGVFGFALEGPVRRRNQ